MNIKTRIGKLESEAQATGETIEHPTAIMFVPFGAPEMPREEFAAREAAAREKQGKPTGVIFVPYPYEEESAP